MEKFSDILREINKNKIEIIEILNYLLGLNIENISIEKNEEYNFISKENGCFFKINGILKNKAQVQFFIKFIEKGKIKETVFDYSYILNQKNYNKTNNYKIKICENEISLWKNKVILRCNREGACSDNNMEIYFFILDKINDNNVRSKIKFLEKIFNKNNILSIGIKYL